MPLVGNREAISPSSAHPTIRFHRRCRKEGSRTHASLTPKHSDPIREHIDVIRRARDTCAIAIDHRCRTDGVEVIDDDVRARAFEGEDTGLAVEGVGWRGACYQMKQACG